MKDRAAQTRIFEEYPVVRAVLALAHTFADCVNRHGGDAKVVYLPDEGITGNSHFMFQEKNNREVFEHIRKWMNEKGI